MLGQVGNEATSLGGEATQTIDPSSNPEKNMKKLDKAIVKLLKNYLPKTEVEVTTVCERKTISQTEFCKLIAGSSGRYRSCRNGIIAMRSVR